MHSHADFRVDVALRLELGTLRRLVQLRLQKCPKKLRTHVRVCIKVIDSRMYASTYTVWK